VQLLKVVLSLLLLGLQVGLEDNAQLGGSTLHADASRRIILPLRREGSTHKPSLLALLEHWKAEGGRK